MADNKELTASLRRFVQSLQTLAEFDTALYSKRLLQASKSTTCLQYFPHFQPADVNQQGTTFDGQDCKDHVNVGSNHQTMNYRGTYSGLDFGSIEHC